MPDQASTGALFSSSVALPVARQRYESALLLQSGVCFCTPSLPGNTCLLLKCSAVTQVANSFVGGDGLRTQYDWLVLFIFMLGTYFFTVGCTLLFVDANNANYPAQMAAWNANRRQGKRPRSVWHVLNIVVQAYSAHDLELHYTDDHGTDITSLVSTPRAMHGGVVSATQLGLYNIILLQLPVWQTTFPEYIIPGLPIPTNGHLQSCIHGVVPSS